MLFNFRLKVVYPVTCNFVSSVGPLKSQKRTTSTHFYFLRHWAYNYTKKCQKRVTKYTFNIKVYQRT